MEKRKRKTHFIIIRVTEVEKNFLIRESKKYKPLGKLSEFIRKTIGLG